MRFARSLRKRPGARAACTALALACAAAAAAAPRALLIGLSYQGDSEVSDLPGIDLDISMMRDVAREFGIEDVRELWDREATLDGIRAAFADVGRGVGPRDLVLVYYSGHGTQVPDRSGDETADGRDEALVPYDFGLRNGVPANALLDDELGELVASIPSRRVLLVVDACHSGTASKSLRLKRDRAHYGKAYNHAAHSGLGASAGGVLGGSRGFGARGARQRPGYVGIMASQDHETAAATPSGSVLTKALLQAVTEARSEGGSGSSIGVERLFGLVKANVEREMARLPRGESQHPSLWPEDGTARDLELPLAGGPPAVPEDDPLIERWRAIADGAARKVEFKVSRQVFRAHPAIESAERCDRQRYGEHLLSLTVVAPDDGYLNVVNATEGGGDPIVMFPNEFDSDNRVRRGQEITLPPPGAGWCLPADLPAGKDAESGLVLGLFSRRNVNYHRDGTGGGAFRSLPGASRGFPPMADGRPAHDAAGSMALRIERR